jgi:hypothetical protein
MEILVKPPHGPVTIQFKNGRLFFKGTKADVEYVQMMVGDQAGPLGHANGENTALDVERRVFAAFGDGAELITGKLEIRPALNRARTMYSRKKRIP